jgi:pimeloyl-ACP methyl ester carboxylesterase
MADAAPPEYVTRANGTRLAFRRVKGKAPTLVFLPGYNSDMQGSKALALEAWAIRRGYAMLRLDYAGCGESGGMFDAETLKSWRDDTVLMIELLIREPILLVGSSMGGWLMLHVALARGTQVAGMVGIAAAPDFTDWGFTSEQKGKIERYGRLEQPSAYASESTVTTRALLASGRALRLLDADIPLDCPVRLLHGQADRDVPWDIALQLAARLRSDDVQVTLIKDGDHRLSRDQDIALLTRTIEALIGRL